MGFVLERRLNRRTAQATERLQRDVVARVPGEPMNEDWLALYAAFEAADWIVTFLVRQIEESDGGSAKRLVNSMSADRLDPALVFGAHASVARVNDAAPTERSRRMAALLSEHFALSTADAAQLAAGRDAVKLGLFSSERVFTVHLLNTLLGEPAADSLEFWKPEDFEQETMLSRLWDVGEERLIAGPA